MKLKPTTSSALVIALLVSFILGTMNAPVVATQTRPQVTLADGSLSAPSLAFASALKTGLYYCGSNTTTFVSNGTAKLAIGSGITATGAITANGGLTLGTGSRLTTESGTATASSGAATLSKQSGTITSESLTTAAAGGYTLTLNNTVVAATSRGDVNVDNGTNSAGIPVVSLVTPSSGQVIIKVYNLHASAAFNGTIKINFTVVL